MITRISINEYLQKYEQIPLVDVRTPAEFKKGHIPGAQNIPLFSNEERAEIGTIYHRAGREKAILAGFDLVGSKWRGFVEKALEIAPDKKIVVHCWRGGMRSGAMAWAFDFYGFQTYVIEGGYKSYRHWALDQFEKKYQIKILGGMTGSYKTDILKKIKEAGQQVIDLEDLAQHQGSAFGSMGIMVQPSQEQFENNLAFELLKVSAEQELWLEDESNNIGKRLIPKSLYNLMQNSMMIELKLPDEQRINHLVAEYGILDPSFLITCVQRIERRLGLDHAQRAIAAITDGRMQDFVKTVLAYYDKGYRKAMANKNSEYIHPLSLNYAGADAAAQKVLGFSNHLNKITIQ